jgi:hypothetical protein
MLFGGSCGSLLAGAEDRVETDNGLASRLDRGKQCERTVFTSYFVRPLHTRGGPWASSILSALFAVSMLPPLSTCRMEEVVEPAITGGAGSPRGEISLLHSTSSARCACPTGTEGSAGLCSCRAGICSVGASECQSRCQHRRS